MAKIILEAKKAVILAGGRNRRMGALAPKATLPVVNRPNVRRIMEKLHADGLTDFFVNSHYGWVLDVAREGKNPSDRYIHTYLESSPIGTATTTKYLVRGMSFPQDEPFLVVGADISHPTMNFRKFARAFEAARDEYRRIVGAVAFVLRPYDEVIDRYPVAIIDGNNLIQRFVERPKTPQEALKIFKQIKARAVREAAERLGVPCLPVNASNYALLRQIYNLVPEPRDVNVDYGKHLFKRMPPGRMFAHFIVESVRRGQSRVKKEWIDMATPSDFWLANWLFIKTAPRKIQGSYDHTHNLRQGKNVSIHPDALVEDSILGENIKIGPGSVISHCVIGGNSLISGVNLSRSIVFKNTHLSVSKATIEDSIIGGHLPLFLEGDLGFSQVSRKLVAYLPSGEILIQDLDIKPGESELAVDCFKKMRLPPKPLEALEGKE